MDSSMRIKRYPRFNYALWPICAILVLLSLMLAGCGATTVSNSADQSAETTPATQTASAIQKTQATQANQGTLAGIVEAGPVSPVQLPDDPNTKPVPNRQVRIQTTSGNLVATATTDGSGHFQVSLAPGTYVVFVPIVTGQIGMRQNTLPPVQVTAGQTTFVKIELDTGIR